MRMTVPPDNENTLRERGRQLPLGLGERMRIQGGTVEIRRCDSR